MSTDLEFTVWGDHKADLERKARETIRGFCDEPGTSPAFAMTVRPQAITIDGRVRLWEADVVVVL